MHRGIVHRQNQNTFLELANAIVKFSVMKYHEKGLAIKLKI